MSNSIDKRNTSYDHLADDVEAFYEHTDRMSAEVDNDLIAERSKVNRFTGHLAELRVEDAPRFDENVEAANVDADYIARARSYIASVSEAIGFATDDPVEFEAEPTVTRTSNGMRVVSLQQMLNGIEVWGMSPKVWLLADGTVDRVVGDTVSVPATLPVKPTVEAEAALRVAAAQAAEPVTLQGPFGPDVLPRLDVSDGFERLSFQPRNDQPMTFSKGAFAEAIPARLVHLYMGGDVRLTWFFTLSRANLAVQYHAFVEADDKTKEMNAPEILYFYDTSNGAVDGWVFRHNPGESSFDQVPFPLPAGAYPTLLPVGLPVGFPADWTEANNGRVSTEGNNVRAFNGRSRQPFQINVDAAGNGLFNAAVGTPEQFVTNIFYFCNYMHDFFMMLGFTEEHGNFQGANKAGQGKGAGAVLAFAHPGVVEETANLTMSADGQSAVMNMGLVRQTGRHTANDADVVFHEFVHAVTNRLVGGMFDAYGLLEEQSRAMGEGWGDYFALTVTNFALTRERVVTGSWVTDRPGGMRQRPYDAQYPGTFGDIGKGKGQVPGASNANLSYREEHDVGEIWCAALMELTRKVAAALDSKERGYRVTWQAVVDGLKLTPKNPSFLMARDAILRAFKAMEGGSLTSAEYAAVQLAVWKAFSKFGMGFDAFCPNASLTGCQGSATMPPAGWQD